MAEQRVSFRYARALLETAKEGNVADTIYQDFLTVNSILNESAELRVFTANPIIPHWRKTKVYDEIFEGKISTLTLKFLQFLLDKKRGDLIRDIIIQYEEQYNKLINKLNIEVTSTIDMTDELKEALKNKITGMTGKTISASYKTDSSLKGGLIVRLDDWVYDSSVKHQLELLYKKLVDDVTVN